MRGLRQRKPPTRRQIADKVAQQLIPALNQQIVNLDSLKAELDKLTARVAYIETEAERVAERSLMERLRESAQPVPWSGRYLR